MIKYTKKDWCSMQDKFRKLFEEIKLEENEFIYYDSSSIEKVILYDQNKIIEFLINTKELIPIETYNNTLEKLSSSFSAFEKINLIILPKNVDYSKLKEYYQYIINRICIERNKYQIFLERDIDITNNIINIKAYNKVECTNLIQIKQEIIDKLVSIRGKQSRKLTKKALRQLESGANSTGSKTFGKNSVKHIVKIIFKEESDNNESK